MRFALLLSLVFCATALGEDASRAAVGWEFDQPGDLQGWQPNASIGQARVAEGVLHLVAGSRDPFLSSAVFELPARPWQEVRIRLKADRAGTGAIFFSSTTEGDFGGFSGKKTVDFRVQGTGDWEEIRVQPYWQGEGKIVHLRFDVYAGTFEVDWLRVVEPGEAEAPSTATEWQFTEGDRQGWRTEEGSLLSPALKVPTGDLGWVQVRLRATAPGRGSLRWAVSEANGLNPTDVFFNGEGRFHTYSLDTASDPRWQGNLLALCVQWTAQDTGEVEVDSVRLANAPAAQPDLDVLYFGPVDGANRVGKACKLMLRLLNRGTVAAEGVRAKLALPAGVRLVGDDPLAPGVRLEYQLPITACYTVTADRPQALAVTAQIAGPGANFTTTSLPMRVTPAPDVPPADYVPPPRPAKTNYLIGSYYYPAWATDRQWRQMEQFAPHCKPLLGYYDESNPEIVDWQIKWAVEHGVQFFLVDWYWEAGRQRYLHYTDAFYKSRYHQFFKWAVMWANHNAPGTHSESDWRKVTQYWLDHYFKTDEYLRLGGKPAVFLWSPGNVERDMGGADQAAKLLALSQGMAKAAGLPGITFVAMTAGSTPTDARRYADEGYTHHTTYHWWADAPFLAKDPKYYPFSLVVDRSRQAWDSREKLVDEAGLKFLPVADTGWDARPRHGTNTHVIYGRTPDQFERLLRDAKGWLDARNEKTLLLGPWNEWTEGSYLEPCSEWDFGMLQAIHRVFCQGNLPQELTPRDLGLGPYDFPLDTLSAEAPTKPVWTFDATGGLEGWSVYMNLTDLTVADGALQATPTSHDPAFASPPLNLRAPDYKYLVVRLQVLPSAEANDYLQVFWTGPTQPATEAASVRATLLADGDMHTYVIPLANEPRWRGMIQQFRVDPCRTAGAKVKIDEFRVTAEAP